MARIDYIRARLENWARWSQQSAAGALGYPKQSTFMRLVPSGGRSESIVPVNDLDASETNDAVNALRFTQSHLYMVLLLTYAKGFPRHAVAQRMGRAESTISRNLEDADRAIARWLEDKQAAKQIAKRSFTT